MPISAPSTASWALPHAVLPLAMPLSTTSPESPCLFACSTTHLDPLKGASLHLARFLHNCMQLFGIERFMQAQRTSHAIQGLTVFSKQTDSTIISPLHDAVNFFINDVSRLLAILA